MTPLLVNTQATTKFVEGADGSQLVLQGEPFQTIQGEGPFSGHPATFVRLWGCDLQCPGCDTDYTSRPQIWSIGWIKNRVKELATPVHHIGKPLVVITGGEPFRQPIGPLVRELCLLDYIVQIETNGTLFRDDLPWLSPNLFVVCSPKTPKVHDQLIHYVTAWKYPIRAGEVDEVDGLPAKILGGLRPFRPPGKALIYVTPMDEGGTIGGMLLERNRKAALASASKFGYVVQEQLHKTLGVP